MYSQDKQDDRSPLKAAVCAFARLDIPPIPRRLLSMILRDGPSLAPGEDQARPSGSAGSGWNECRGSAGRVEKRVRSINQPPPW